MVFFIFLRCPGARVENPKKVLQSRRYTESPDQRYSGREDCIKPEIPRNKSMAYMLLKNMQ